MDLNNLKDQVSNLTLYDLKAGVRKVQNGMRPQVPTMNLAERIAPAVMNYTEMEAKVREATNNEPWGASSTLMQEIANGTHSYHLLNEIMPMIYKRFTEKAAEEWRQIYKALQLMEFLIKNGSERVIDDARSHLSLLKMLRQFHYIDQNGKDQGVNVRNRSKELADLLSDVDRIRAERKKARANRNKFGGVEGGAMSGGLSGGSRYGGFGSEDAGYGGYSGGVYGDGGGFGGNTSGFQDSSSRRDRFEEYDEYDEDGSAPVRQKPDTSTGSSSTHRETKKAEPLKPKEPEVDFLSFDDDVPPETPPKEVSANGKKAAPASVDNGLGSLQSGAADDDDFGDFQSATPTTTASSKPSLPGLPIAAPNPMAPPQGANFSNLAGFSSISLAPSTTSSMISSTSAAPNYSIDLSSPPPQQKPSASQQPFTSPQQQHQKPTGYQASAPNYFTSVPAPQPTAQQPSTTPGTRAGISSGNSKTASTISTTKARTPGGGSDVFGSLWSTASSSAGIKNSTTAGSSGPNLASLQREKASQGIWGHSAATPAGAAGVPTTAPSAGIGIPGQSNGQKSSGGGSGLEDLLG
ncbi:MAG: hypothetical protein Q9217_000002 [Psora testacea]